MIWFYFLEQGSKEGRKEGRTQKPTLLRFLQI